VSAFIPGVSLAAPSSGSASPVEAAAPPPQRERPAADFIPRPDRPPPPTDPADTCAVVPDIAPDFTLEDVNPTSPTYGELVPRTDPDSVTVLYFALPSCGHCQADVDALGALVDAQGEAWSDVSVRIVAFNAAAESLPELADGHDLPILVDTEALDLESAYGAERWFIYLLDRDGIPQTLHYSLNFATEADRLVAEVDSLLAEGSP
jgi:hypothetical protein